jgi:hypothetical protein
MLLADEGNKKEGKYMFTQNEETVGLFLLSVIYKGTATHHKIQRNALGTFAVNGMDTKCATLAGVVKFLSEAQPDWPVPLSEPIHREPHAGVNQTQGVASKYMPLSSTKVLSLHPNLPKSAIVGLLLSDDVKVEEGKYLFTSETEPGTFLLNVIYLGKVTQHFVKWESSGTFAVNESHTRSTTLAELVTHLSEKHSFWPIALTVPVNHVGETHGDLVPLQAVPIDAPTSSSLPTTISLIEMPLPLNLQLVTSIDEEYGVLEADSSFQNANDEYGVLQHVQTDTLSTSQKSGRFSQDQTYWESKEVEIAPLLTPKTNAEPTPTVGSSEGHDQQQDLFESTRASKSLVELIARAGIDDSTDEEMKTSPSPIIKLGWATSTQRSIGWAGNSKFVIISVPDGAASCDIYFTTNGSDPVESEALLYDSSAPPPAPSSALNFTVKAIALSSFRDKDPSEIVTYAANIEEQVKSDIRVLPTPTVKFANDTHTVLISGIFDGAMVYYSWIGLGSDATPRIGSVDVPPDSSDLYGASGNRATAALSEDLYGEFESSLPPQKHRPPQILPSHDVLKTEVSADDIYGPGEVYGPDQQQYQVFNNFRNFPQGDDPSRDHIPHDDSVAGAKEIHDMMPTGGGSLYQPGEKLRPVQSPGEHTIWAIMVDPKGIMEPSPIVRYTFLLEQAPPPQLHYKNSTVLLGLIEDSESAPALISTENHHQGEVKVGAHNTHHDVQLFYSWSGDPTISGNLWTAWSASGPTLECEPGTTAFLDTTHPGRKVIRAVAAGPGYLCSDIVELAINVKRTGKPRIDYNVGQIQIVHEDPNTSIFYTWGGEKPAVSMEGLPLGETTKKYNSETGLVFDTHSSGGRRELKAVARSRNSSLSLVAELVFELEQVRPPLLVFNTNLIESFEIKSDAPGAHIVFGVDGADLIAIEGSSAFAEFLIPGKHNIKTAAIRNGMVSSSVVVKQIDLEQSTPPEAIVEDGVVSVECQGVVYIQWNAPPSFPRLGEHRDEDEFTDGTKRYHPGERIIMDDSGGTHDVLHIAGVEPGKMPSEVVTVVLRFGRPTIRRLPSLCPMQIPVYVKVTHSLVVSLPSAEQNNEYVTLRCDTDGATIFYAWSTRPIIPQFLPASKGNTIAYPAGHGELPSGAGPASGTRVFLLKATGEYDLYFVAAKTGMANSKDSDLHISVKDLETGQEQEENYVGFGDLDEEVEKEHNITQIELNATGGKVLGLTLLVGVTENSPLTVGEVDENGQAAGKLKANDFVYEVNGKSVLGMTMASVDLIMQEHDKVLFQTSPSTHLVSEATSDELYGDVATTEPKSKAEIDGFEFSSLNGDVGEETAGLVKEEGAFAFPSLYGDVGGGEANDGTVDPLESSISKAGIDEEDNEGVEIVSSSLSQEVYASVDGLDLKGVHADVSSETFGGFAEENADEQGPEIYDDMTSGEHGNELADVSSVDFESDTGSIVYQSLGTTEEPPSHDVDSGSKVYSKLDKVASIRRKKEEDAQGKPLLPQKSIRSKKSESDFNIDEAVVVPVSEVHENGEGTGPSAELPMVTTSLFTTKKNEFSVEDVGRRVKVDEYEAHGTILFVGLHQTLGKPRVGIELDAAVGKHSGTVKGHTYFKCKAAGKYGILTQSKKVKFLTKDELDVDAEERCAFQHDGIIIVNEKSAKDDSDSCLVPTSPVATDCEDVPSISAGRDADKKSANSIMAANLKSLHPRMERDEIETLLFADRGKSEDGKYLFTSKKKAGNFQLNVVFKKKIMRHKVHIGESGTFTLNGDDVGCTTLEDVEIFLKEKVPNLKWPVRLTHAVETSAIHSENDRLEEFNIGPNDVGSRVGLEEFGGDGRLQYLGKHRETGVPVAGVELDMELGNLEGNEEQHGILVDPKSITLIPKSVSAIDANVDADTAEVVFVDAYDKLKRLALIKMCRERNLKYKEISKDPEALRVLLRQSD